MINFIVPVIILVIILLQFYFFVRNILRMDEFKNIFNKESSWSIIKDEYTGFVSGISGNGNKVFTSIIDSTNKYLGNNSGSVIDFQLLKDTVDRHCDSVEEDINVQTPVPLYCGLAGTMAGVILGLFPLIKSGALIYLLSGNVPQNMSKEMMDQIAANGINELLTGVAWAMIASICGIFFTTLSSLLFKKHKLKEESGKNSFLAWMQSSLLPELPSDTSDALNRLVRNLNHFNDVFASNTSELKETLEKVNEVYDSQNDIIQAVRDMDVMKMAKANVKVLQELQACTDQIGDLKNYLLTVNDYTTKLKKFTDEFDSESDRLHILEEIRDFFNRHKGEIAKETADTDDALNTALSNLRQSSKNGISNLEKELVQHSESFKTMLDEEKRAFESMLEDQKAIYGRIANDMSTQFNERIQEFPTIQNNLEKISMIPDALDKLFVKIEDSNSKLLQNLNTVISKKVVGYDYGSNGFEKNSINTIPSWFKWTIIGGIVVITLSSVTNTVYNILKNEQIIKTTDKVQKNAVSQLFLDKEFNLYR